MEENKDFIKGGLPLGSGDFVDKSKAQENKNKLLAAISNINKIHSKKMSAETSAAAKDAQNIDAVGITLDMLDKDNSYEVPGKVKDEYILSDQIVRDPAPAPTQPVFDDVDNFQPAESFDFDDLPMAESVDMETTQSDDLGKPIIVVDDAKIGKKGKSSKNKSISKNCTPEQIKSGRWVAWLAYIFFLIPLILNGKNAYVRHHANEGLELNIVDVIAVGLYLAYKFVVVENYWLNLALLVGSIIGIILIAITTIAKVFLILFAWAGKEAQSPFFGKAKIIK